VTEIVEITAAETHDLRRRVLRDGTRSDALVWDGDEDPTTFHLGARTDGELVAISTWLRRRYPDRPADEAFQLRGMATEPSRRGSGVSGRLLRAGLDRCAEQGAILVWARARVAAISFYERHGFVPVGPEYTDLTTGLRHRDILRPS
jgi:predicted GNAT family N-acyltransferase